MRSRLIGAAVVTVALSSAVLPQQPASAGVSPAEAAWAAKVAVEKASVSTLAARHSMDVAYAVRQATSGYVVLWRRRVVQTWVSLENAPVNARPALLKSLTSQTATWHAWVWFYNQRNALYLSSVRANAATEADFQAKSANALFTARAVPISPACGAPANPYIGSAARRLMTYPGMSITQFAKPGRTTVWVTEANLNAPGSKTSVGPLSAPYVASRSLLAQQLAGSGALAGVNADFYDLGGDNSTWGVLIKRYGGIVKSGTVVGFPSFFVQPNRLASIGYVAVDPVLHHGSQSVRADSLNSHLLPVNGIAVFTSAWGPASRAALKPVQAAREYAVDSRGVVVAIRPGLSNVAIPRSGLVIVAQGSAISRLNAAGFGGFARVGLTSSATSSAGAGVFSAVGVGTQFLEDGQLRVPCVADHPVARQAIGIKPGGREIVLVTVRGGTDSQSGRYTGVGGATTRDVAALMRSLGVYNAAMFDGGGSTILMAKFGASYRQFQAAPGWIRPVSDSLGIWRG